jgi:hypothetical protein
MLGSVRRVLSVAVLCAVRQMYLVMIINVFGDMSVDQPIVALLIVDRVRNVVLAVNAAIRMKNVVLAVNVYQRVWI